MRGDICYINRKSSQISPLEIKDSSVEMGNFGFTNNNNNHITHLDQASVSVVRGEICFKLINPIFPQKNHQAHTW